MKFSDLNFKVITSTFERSCRLMAALEKINRPVKDKDAFIKAWFVKIFESVVTYWNQNEFQLFYSLESKEVTFEEAIKLIESCEPVVKKPSGKFVEYDIDENGDYNLESGGKINWQEHLVFEIAKRCIFGGWLWVHPDKPRNNCWSTSRMGIWNSELTTASYAWEYPIIPKKIRFWVND